MSQRDDNYSDSDSSDEDLGVDRVAHGQGNLKSGSTFSRGQGGVASWGSRRYSREAASQPVQTSRNPQGTPNARTAAPYNARTNNSASPRSVPLPQSRASYGSSATQYRPAYSRGQGQGARPIDPDANRAAFDARYSDGGVYGSDVGYGAQQSGSRQRKKRLKRDDSYGENGMRPRRRHHWLRNTFIILLVAIVGLYMTICVPIDEEIAFDSSTQESLSSTLTSSIPLMPYYVLLLGSDARSDDTSSRTDTMILLRVDPLQNKYTMVSIPRDTEVEISGYGTQKINAAYTYGGASGAASAASELLGVNISQVALIHFDGIETLVDAIGGITVDVPVDVNDPDYTGLVMSAGTYEMDGETALLFSRVRHGFALGDFQRQADQQLVIQAIIAKIRTLPITELSAVAQTMGSLLSTTMHCYDILPLLIRMSITSPTIYQASIPSTTATINGVSYVVADESALSEMMSVVDAGGDPSTVTSGLE